LNFYIFFHFSVLVLVGSMRPCEIATSRKN